MKIHLVHKIFLFFVLMGPHASAQILLERQVVGSTGKGETAGNAVIEFTVGEAVITTQSSGTTTFTQGFHQPNAPTPLLVSLSTSPATCPGFPNGSITIDNISGCHPPYQITWSTGDSVLALDQLIAGTYRLLISTSYCSFDTTIVIEELDGPCPLHFFSGLTPNDDGQNDIWIIGNIDLPDYRENEVKIFSRSGQEVFSIRGYNNRDQVFRGDNKQGKQLPSGTYFYTVDVNNEVFKGYIEITR